MTQLSLFGDTVVDVPRTQGIKYAGSKLKLLPYILEMAAKVEARTVLDGFSGTTRVSQAFARRGYTVFCNDTAAWSRVFGTCYLLNKKGREEYQALIDHLNALRPVDGWFTEHYGGWPNDGCAIQRDGRKRPWQIHNTRKLDAIRSEIEALALDPVTKAVALTSLMLALDRVDSSLGHFASYLKDWSPRSYKDLALDVPHVVPASSPHQVFQRDILDLAPRVAVDLAYFDPPYGSSNEKMPPSRVRYAAYYHVWTSIVLFDNPDLFGKANRRCDSADSIAASAFEEFRRSERGCFIAVEAIEQLIQATPARWTILSYSSGGRATARELEDVLRRHGRLLNVVEIEYQKNVMANMKWTNEWTAEAADANREFLFLLEKRAV